MKKKVLAMLLLGASILTASAAPALASYDTNWVWTDEPMTQTPKYADIVWATVPDASGEDVDLKLNIFQADDVTENSPVVVFIHGGAWREGSYALSEEFAGDWTNEEISNILSLVDEGVSVVSIDYRLSQQAAYPAQIEDCKGAVRWIKAHASEYGLDPERVACAGTSAGAHLALLLATTGDVAELEGETGGNLDQSSRVMACVDFFGMTDIINLSSDLYDTPYNIDADSAYYQVDSYDSARSQLIGFNAEGQGMGVLRAEQNNPDTEYGDYLELVKQASPIYYVSSDDAPLFMGQGGKDPRVAVAQAQRLQSLYIQAGLEATLCVNSKAGHGDLGKYVNEGALQFLRVQFGLE